MPIAAPYVAVAGFLLCGSGLGADNGYRGQGCSYLVTAIAAGAVSW